MDQLIAEFSTHRVRDRCNLVLEAAQTHLTIVSNNQHQGAQLVDSNTHRYTKPRPALPVAQETTQRAAAQTGTTATARLSHLYCSNESGTKAATPRCDTVTNAIVSVDTIYDLHLAQTNEKK